LQYGDACSQKVIVKILKNNFIHHPTMLGFSLLELVVVICLISLLFVFAADRLLRLQAQAERVAMQQVVGTLQSALAMVIAEHVAKGRIAELDQLAGSNPMVLLAEVPVNFQGVISHADINSLEAGNWYFASHSGNLIYCVINQEDFITELAGQPRIHLRIMPVYDDRNGNGQFEPQQDQIRGLRLQLLDNYSWAGVSLAGMEYVAPGTPSGHR